MSDPVLDRLSLWEATTAMSEHPELAFNVRVNVAIVGGGVAGVTAAYLLKKAGRSVALIDGNQCGLGQSGRTTGHVASLPDWRPTALIERHGAERTRLLWEAGNSAIARIRAIVRDERINCQFAWVPAYLQAGPDLELASMRDDLLREVSAAESLGLDLTYREYVPGTGRPGVRFDGQARLHPLNYLRVLVDQLPGAGSYVFEKTYVDAVDGDGPFVVRCGEYKVTADYVVAATHDRVFRSMWAPGDPGVPDLRVARTYVVGGLTGAQTLDEGLYWHLDDGSFDCMRLDRQEDQTLALAGIREPFGQELSEARSAFRLLSDRLTDRIPGVEIQHRWSGYVVETADGLPCVGEVSPGRFVAAALGENSLTFGTLAGMLTTDLMLGRPNPCRSCFDPERFSSREHGRLEQTIGAGPGRQARGRQTFASLTHQDVAFAHTDEALPPTCVY